MTVVEPKLRGVLGIAAPLEVDPDPVGRGIAGTAWATLGMLLHGQSRFDEAIEAQDRAISLLQPEYDASGHGAGHQVFLALGYLTRGQSLISKQRHWEAGRDLIRALELCEAHAPFMKLEIQILLGQVHMYQAPNLALDYSEAAFEGGKNSSDVLVRLLAIQGINVLANPDPTIRQRATNHAVELLQQALRLGAIQNDAYLEQEPWKSVVSAHPEIQETVAALRKAGKLQSMGPPIIRPADTQSLPVLVPLPAPAPSPDDK